MRCLNTHEVAEKAPACQNCCLQARIPRCVARWTDHPARYLMGIQNEHHPRTAPY